MTVGEMSAETSEHLLFRRSLTGGIAARGLQVVLLIVLGAVLTAEGFGTYSAVYMTIFAAAAAVSGALGVAANSTVAAQPEMRVAARAWWTVLGVSGVVAIVTALIGSKLLTALTDSAVSAHHLVLAAAGIVVLNDAQLSMLAGLSRSLPLAYLETLRGALALVAGLIGAIWMGAAGALAGFALGEATTAAIAATVVWKRIRHIAPDPADGPIRVTSLGTTALLGFVSGAMIQVGMWWGQLWALEGSSTAKFAVLAMALRLTNMVVVLPGMLSRNYLARLKSVSSRPGEWSLELRSFLRRVGALGLVGAMAVLVLAAALPILLGNGYRSLLGLSAVLAVGMLASCASSALGIALLTRSRLATWFTSDVLIATLLIVGMVVMKDHGDARWVYAAVFACANIINLVVRLPAALARGSDR